MNLITSVTSIVRNADHRDYLLSGFVIFILGYFLATGPAVHAGLYYVFILPPLFYCLSDTVQLYKTNTLLKIIFLFCFYFFLSIFWSDNISWQGILISVTHILLVLSFPAAVLLTATWYPQQFEQLFRVAVILAGIFALVSIITFYAQQPFPEARLRFVGYMNQPTKSSCVYALFSLLAIHFAMLSTSARKRWLFIALAFIIFFAVLLSQSRTALIAFFAGFIVLLSRNHIKILSLLVVSFIALLFIYPVFVDLLAARGYSYRPGIWQYIISQLSNDVWFGIGLLSPTEASSGLRWHSKAHSQIVATYRDGGVVGLLMLGAILLVALQQAIKLYLKGWGFYLALLVFAIVSMIPIQDRLITRPRQFWLYVWWPLILIAAYQINGKLFGKNIGHR